MATLKIPAGYLEDARRGAAVEMTMSSESLRDGDAVDRPANVVMLERDVRLHSALCAADGEVEVSAEQDIVSSPIEHMLEQVVRIMAKRLDDVKQYGPIPMGDILDIADELRWAATETIRIEPCRNDREPVA